MKEESQNPEIAALNRIAFERHLRLQKFPEQAPGNGDNDKPDQFRCFLGLDCKELPLHPYRLMEYHKKEGWRWGESEDASRRIIVDKATDASASTQSPLPCKASARNVCLEGIGDRRPIFETLEKGLAKLTDAVGLVAAKAADTLFMFSLSGGDGGQVERRHVFALLTLPCYSPKVTFVVGELVDESSQGIHCDSVVPPTPFLVRLRSRACLITDTFRSIDEVTSSELALQLLGHGRVQAFRLNYEVQADLWLNKVTGVIDEGIMFSEGSKFHFTPNSSATRCDLGWLPSANPFEGRRGARGRGSRGRGQGRGRGRGQGGSPQAKHAPGGEANPPHPAPIDDGMVGDHSRRPSSMSSMSLRRPTSAKTCRRQAARPMPSWPKRWHPC